MEQQLPDYLLGVTYEEDGRLPRPDKKQKKAGLASFRSGWSSAIAGRFYELETLSNLTWNNYGYRIGMLEGEVEPDIQEQLFEALYESQQRKLNTGN